MNISIQVNSLTGKYGIIRADSDNIRDATDANVRLGFGIATFVMCLILNILSLRILMRMKNTQARTIQRTFFAISSCIFATQAMNVTVACLISIFNTNQMTAALAIAYDGVNYFSDLYSIGPALYTILLPGLIRLFLIRKCRKALRMSTDDSININPPSVTHIVTQSRY